MMKKTKNCIIADDEPIARAIVANYIEQIPSLNLLIQCKDAFEVIEAINENDIDLLFLDINMPGLSGLDLIRSIRNVPEVIITTAYPEYAVEGFELSVVDYLLKPFSFERFVQAINKTAKLDSDRKATPDPRDNDIIFVRADQRLVRVVLSEIRFVEAYGNYIKIHLPDNKIISKQTLTQFEAELPANSFIRIHKSYIVPVRQIDYLEGNAVSVAGKILPVGKVFRSMLVERLDGR